ncbi:hypothetical protein CC86DRAFT_385797 [Ophiobolus disseminans]|uniref:Uncharacterized protein n=1 Tax=Ophiobolus disseminans TaxID=1469910 RepID=A0A6A6ZN49_9PLEO|nr:hypothetical protein CC86DRAFT_385797 [Ophiobolus disseminans]
MSPVTPKPFLFSNPNLNHAHAMQPQPPPKPPHVVAFESTQASLLHDLHAFLARGRAELLSMIKDADPSSALSTLCKEQHQQLDAWEKGFEFTWLVVQKGNTEQKTQFLCSKTEGLRGIVGRFKERWRELGGIEVLLAALVNARAVLDSYVSEGRRAKDTRLRTEESSIYEAMSPNGKSQHDLYLSRLDVMVAQARALRTLVEDFKDQFGEDWDWMKRLERAEDGSEQGWQTMSPPPKEIVSSDTTAITQSLKKAYDSILNSVAVSIQWHEKVKEQLRVAHDDLKRSLPHGSMTTQLSTKLRGLEIVVSYAQSIVLMLEEFPINIRAEWKPVKKASLEQRRVFLEKKGRELNKQQKAFRVALEPAVTEGGCSFKV